ncbi:MAG TPA: hypothetical protein VGN17_30390 [Bryobacteraceae bacterium]|jgi:glyoxylase-like metal-dependent hydrolase (beta-lactamase superfamily II)
MKKVLLLSSALLAASLPAFSQLNLSGVWADRITEDNYERSGGPPLGDYQGIPLNDAGRMKADSHDHSEWSLPEFQCRPHPAPYQWRALGAVRISELIDPVSRELTAYHLEYLRSMDRMIYMDGRPHPPEYAPHSWSGFSTGVWQGNMLVVTTTHIKGAYLRRNGASFSDKATMQEFITRHGNYMLVTMIITDPVWLETPFIQTTHYEFDPATTLSYYPCTVSEENISTAVPHFLPGQNPNLMADDIPAIGARGGAAEDYPEFRQKMKAGTASPTAGPPSNVMAKASLPPSPPKAADTAIHVLPVQGNIYMLVGPWGNIAASIGKAGILLVDSGLKSTTTPLMAKVLELATQITASPQPNHCVGLHCESNSLGWTSPLMNTIIASPAPPKPIRFILNTSVDPDRVGGNEKLAELPETSKIVGVTFPPVGTSPSATVISHENILKRMSEKGPDEAPSGALPTDTFRTNSYKLSEFFNNEGVMMYHEPAAHTDGDSIVYFRYSDVIAAGNLLNTESYPMIDVARGGTIQGVLDGLNHILDLSIPEFRSQGGTWVIPGHGRLCDIGDVANYRNMVAIIRDRVQDMVNKGATLAQVKAAKMTMDYDGLYGATSGPWTTDMFVEAVYKTLKRSTSK